MIHMEVRYKIIEAWGNGLRIHEIANAYSYSESAISRLVRQYRESGDITPKIHLRGRKPAIDEQGLEAMRQLILNKADITLEEIKEALGLTISLAAICKTVRGKLGFRYKKRRYMPVSESGPTS